MKYLQLILFQILLAATACANNLQIQQASIASVDYANDYAYIEFDISWENSWRDTANWDAAWVFVKYRPQGQAGAWLHATIHALGHQIPSAGSIDVPTDRRGVFLYRNGNGVGNFSLTAAQLRWDYGADGLADGTQVDVAVLGIEMVYVPTTAFFVGDGENRAGQVYGHFEAGTTGAPFQVTSEAAIALGGGSLGSLGNNNEEGVYCCGGMLNGAADDFNDVSSQLLPAAFPKGFQAFYCMKYELTQQQYVDFLNMLSPAQVTPHTSTTHFVGSPSPFSFYRYGLSGSHPNFTTSHPYAPMIYLGWAHGAAYADWSGLRPMTELEFEKACRGPVLPVMGEFPWGTTGIDLSDNLTLSNIGTANEQINTGYSTTLGNSLLRTQSQTIETVVRVGIFAANTSNAGRVTSGATYYGIMEMGGNCWERCVSVGHAQGRGFIGNHGDGSLHANGFANETSWPGQFGNGYVETNLGVGYRGAGLAFPNPNLERNARISSRRLATEFWDIVLYDDGMRFVRTL